MPHRKLVKIGIPQQMPTIRDFLTEMANRQHDEISRLKSEALGRHAETNAPNPDEAEDRIVPDPWQLHPVAEKKPRARTAKRAPVTKAAANSKKTNAATSTRTRSAAKKSAKKAAQPRARKT